MTKKDIKNALFGYTALYTFATILNSILYLSQGVYEDPSGNWHELDRAIIVFIGVLALELCLKLKIKSTVLRLVVSYIPTMLLVFGYVWFRGLREELASTAYRDIWINFTALFVIGGIIMAVVGLISKKKRKSNN